MNKENKIILIGSGGDGIKFLGQAFGNYLVELGLKVALTLTYDSAVRGGDILAFITFGKGLIENPIIDKADLAIYLSESDKKFETKKTIKLKKEQTNMNALGVLIKEFDLEFDEEKLRSVLPENSTPPSGASKQENLEKIKEEVDKLK